MRTFHLILLCCSFVMPCFGEEQEQVIDAINYEEQNGDDSQHTYSMEYSLGFTVATLDSYHLKVTAEQRYSDNKVQIVILPEEQGVRFNVHRVEFGKAPRFLPNAGTVAKVFGAFSIVVSNWRREALHKMIPVRIQPVSQFSITAEEARIQGKTCIQKDFDHMLTEQ